MSALINDSADENDSSESEIEIREQASFMERLGCTKKLVQVCKMYTHAKQHRMPMLRGNRGC